MTMGFQGRVKKLKVQFLSPRLAFEDKVSSDSGGRTFLPINMSKIPIRINDISNSSLQLLGLYNSH